MGNFWNSVKVARFTKYECTNDNIYFRSLTYVCLITRIVKVVSMIHNQFIVANEIHQLLTVNLLNTRIGVLKQSHETSTQMQNDGVK